MRQDADTVIDGVEGFGLVGGGAGEYDGGGECEERWLLFGCAA